jgi:small nuclear ribonucleoprotein (snRNP)-like protein
MLFYSFFKTLVGRDVTVELKNDLAVTGVLHSVDQYLNVKLASVRVANPEKHPQVGMKAGREGRREPFLLPFPTPAPSSSL